MIRNNARLNDLPMYFIKYINKHFWNFKIKIVISS